MKENGKLFFSVYNSLEAVSLERKSTVFRFAEFKFLLADERRGFNEMFLFHVAF